LCRGCLTAEEEVEPDEELDEEELEFGVVERGVEELDEGREFEGEDEEEDATGGDEDFTDNFLSPSSLMS